MLIHEQELARIGDWVLEYPDEETGGDLFGFFTYSGHPVVQYVLGPGPGARRTEVSFYQDRAFLIEAGRLLQERHGFQHVGEWHSHHRLGLDHPSAGDVATVARARERSGLPSFLLGIATIEEAPKAAAGIPHLNGYTFRSDEPRTHERCSWVVLPGPSPVRSDKSLRHIERRTLPTTRAARTVVSPLGSLQARRYSPPPLRVSSWAQTATGTRLLGAIRDELMREAAVVMRPTPCGLLEMQLDGAAGRWLAVWSDDTSFDSASVVVTEIADSERPPETLCGTATAVVRALAALASSGATEQAVDEAVRDQPDGSSTPLTAMTTTNATQERTK